MVLQRRVVGFATRHTASRQARPSWGAGASAAAFLRYFVAGTVAFHSRACCGKGSSSNRSNTTALLPNHLRSYVVSEFLLVTAMGFVVAATGKIQITVPPQNFRSGRTFIGRASKVT